MNVTSQFSTSENVIENERLPNNFDRKYAKIIVNFWLIAWKEKKKVELKGSQTDIYCLKRSLKIMKLIFAFLNFEKLIYNIDLLIRYNKKCFL